MPGLGDRAQEEIQPTEKADPDMSSSTSSQIRNLRMMILDKQGEMEDAEIEIANLSQLLAEELAKRDGITLNETVVQTRPQWIHPGNNKKRDLWLVTGTIPDGTKIGYHLAGVAVDEQHRVVDRQVYPVKGWDHPTAWSPPSGLNPLDRASSPEQEE